MCVIIFAGKERNPLWETGLDMCAPIEGNVGDLYFMQKNSGAGKQFPGGPSCTYKDVTVPCLCRWSKKGGITTKILCNILAALNNLKVLEEYRRNGIKLFLLVDGHRSRLEPPFVRYIHNPEHKRAVTIGVPYGIQLW